MSTITSANATIFVGAKGFFPVPQQLQGFAVDDVYDVSEISPAEVLMGVDGIMSAGFVFVPVPQNFALQADSPSIAFFDALFAGQVTAKEIIFLFGITHLPSIGKSFTMNNGVLTNYKPMPDGKKVLQPQKFGITWNSVTPVPV